MLLYIEELKICGGNAMQICDGINFTNSQAWICTDSTKYESDKFASPYTKLSWKCPSTYGFIKDVGYDANFPALQLTKTTGGSETTYIPDQSFYSDKSAILVVGSLTSGLGTGLWNYNWTYYSYNNIQTHTSRLLYIPPDIELSYSKQKFEPGFTGKLATIKSKLGGVSGLEINNVIVTTNGTQDYGSHLEGNDIIIDKALIAATYLIKITYSIDNEEHIYQDSIIVEKVIKELSVTIIPETDIQVGYTGQIAEVTVTGGTPPYTITSTKIVRQDSEEEYNSYTEKLTVYLDDYLGRGIYDIKVTVKDSDGNVGEGTVSFEIKGIIIEDIPDNDIGIISAKEGEKIGTITVSGGTPKYEYKVIGNNADDFMVEGTDIKLAKQLDTGIYQASIEVTDSNKQQATSNTFTLKVENN